MIAARKLYLIATGVGEFFEGASTFADVSVPAHLKDALGDTKVYVRLGTRAKSFAYQVANQDQMRHFGQMIGPQSQMLNNLQEKVMPWTSRKGMGQKVDGNMMAQVYYGIVRKEPAKEQIHGPTLEALKGDRNLYRALGFRDDLAAQQAAVLERLVAGGSLRDFLDRPSVQSEFRRNRIDKSLVEASLNAEIIQVLLEAFKQWKPDLPVKGTGPVENARSIFPALWKDMAAYHSALLEKDYISVRRLPFFKPTLEKAYEEGLPPKERAKRESFYKPVAVALVAKREANASPVPESWKALETYVDPVTGGEFSDYQIDTPAGTGIVCLIKGGSPEAARHAVDGLLNPRGEPLINDPKERIKGVRISELFFNELKSSCLHPHSIARTQFYTSFSMADSLRFLRGTSKEPTVEMVVEALKPCSIFRYSDEYCRVKPSEMVRVKYRTPTGEAQNPCWDASATLGGLNEARMQERFSDAKWSLVLIEGEKKAALLAQMMQDWKLPFHVIAIPGVWMAMKGSKGNRVLSEFFDKFVMRDALGNHRKCLVFFDNDKAYNVSVTQAMVETAVCMQAKGGDVFIPNLPFGKKVKGADDFAQARCRKEDGIDYQPLVDIIDNAVYVPVKAFPIKHQTSDQQRQVKRFMYQAERVHELQQALRKSADPVHSKEFPQLVVLLAPYVLGGKERQALETFNAMNEEGKTALLERVLKDNPCLKQLKHSMAAHIPNFDSGTALKDFQEENVARSPNAQAKPFVFSEDFFAIG